MCQELAMCYSCLPIQNCCPEWLSNPSFVTQLSIIWIKCVCVNLPYSKESYLGKGQVTCKEHKHTLPAPQGVSAKQFTRKHLTGREGAKHPQSPLLSFQSAMLWADIAGLEAPLKGLGEQPHPCDTLHMYKESRGRSCWNHHELWATGNRTFLIK